jgi:hypothetical protein
VVTVEHFVTNLVQLSVQLVREMDNARPSDLKWDSDEPMHIASQTDIKRTTILN